MESDAKPQESTETPKDISGLACQVPGCTGRRGQLDIVCPDCWGQMPRYLKVAYWDAHKAMAKRVRQGNAKPTKAMRSAVKGIVEALKEVAIRKARRVQP